MRVRPLSHVGWLVAAACSGDPYPSQSPSTGGTGASSGGSAVPGTGGATGGAVAATGGNPGQPGTGGATGGSSANGGSSGALSTGGVSSGGLSAGGSSVGSSGSGGTANGGGKSTGGASAGGTGNGGSKSTGGASAGGASNGGSGGGSGTLTYAALCGSCHGAKGEGVASLGPEIQHPVRDFSTWVVRNGRSGHPSFPGSVMAAFPASALPDATLAAFFDELSTPAIPKPTTGAALYADYCATCHGATGVGGPAAHNAKGQPLSKALSLVRSGHSLTQFSLRNGYMPKWSTSELSDAEVGLIVTHLDSL